MRVGIIGAGNMGSAFARRVSAAGHDVLIASKDMSEAEQVAASTGAKVKAVPQGQLAGEVDLLIAATPYAQQADALRSSGSLDGRIVIEISNPMTEDMSGLAVGFTTSAAEEVAASTPGANVVKAFNTVFAQVLGQTPTGRNAARVQVFYAGDDDSAKKSVRSLIESMEFDPVDAGPLRNARLLEPLGMLNIYFGYKGGMGTSIAPAVRSVSEPSLEGRADESARPAAPTRSDATRDEERRPRAD